MHTFFKVALAAARGSNFASTASQKEDQFDGTVLRAEDVRSISMLPSPDWKGKSMLNWPLIAISGIVEIGLRDEG